MDAWLILGVTLKLQPQLFTLYTYLSIIFLINRQIFGIENIRKLWRLIEYFSKPNMTSSNVLFCSQPKDVQFTVIKK